MLFLAQVSFPVFHPLESGKLGNWPEQKKLIYRVPELS
jgi:hypothetical protein